MCGARIKEFLPGGEGHTVLIEKSVIGGGPRSNALCPICFAVDRERLIYLYLNNKRHLLAPGIRLLHMAPEPKLGAWLKAVPGLDYVTADFSMSYVDLRIDLTKAPFRDATFDGIICNHVLEHIPDDAQAMAELRRILRPAGWAILQVPISSSLPSTYEDFSITDPKERERAFGQDDHVRIYARDYVDRLADAGFSVSPFRWLDDKQNYGGAANRFGLIEQEALFIASRPADERRLTSALHPSRP